MTKAVGYLREVSVRLNKVVVEQLDFERLLKVYDRSNALFYLDPPYFHAEKYYQVSFGAEDHVRLRDTLGRIQGRFLLSYNDCEEARELYKEFVILEVDRGNNLSSGTIQKRYPELIIKNY